MNDRQRLHEWMDKSDMSGSALAEALGFHRSYISLVLSGDRPISGEFKWRFLSAFGSKATTEVFPLEATAA